MSSLFKHAGTSATRVKNRDRIPKRGLNTANESAHSEPRQTGRARNSSGQLTNVMESSTLMHHPPTESLVEAIKLSVTPVFLLVGISSIMGILTARFSRTIDRYEALSVKCVDEESGELPSAVLTELKIFRQRLFLLLRAIQLLTLGLMGTALVVTLIFVGTITFIDLTRITAVMFFMVMALIAAAAMLYLREIQLAVIQTNRFTDLNQSFRSSARRS